MSGFQESNVKTTVRALLRSACESLQRSGLTYCGLPGALATDVRLLGGLLENAICIDDRKATLEEMRRNMATLPLKGRQFIQDNIWTYLRERYPAEPLVADVTFLDFCGGGIQKDDPFASEIAGIRSYFAKHAQHRHKAFVLAWTYMPRDKGEAKYLATLEKMVNDKVLLEAVKANTGVWLRSAAIRVVLWQSLQEHGMSCNVFHHALYKRSMNTIIVIFAKGTDPDCRISLESPRNMLTEPAYAYDEGKVVPRVVPVLDV